MERTVPSPLKGILDKSLSSPVVNTSDLNLCVRTLVLNEQSRFKYRTPSGNFRDHPRVLHIAVLLQYCSYGHAIGGHATTTNSIIYAPA